MIKKILSVLVIAALSGCAVNYTLDGQKYSSKEAYQEAGDLKMARILSDIVPLPAPVSKKKLIFAIPSEMAILTEATSRFVKAQGREPVGNAKEIIGNSAKAAYKDAKLSFDAVQKKNIYASTQLIDMPTMTGSFEASSDADTLYGVEPAPGSAQWFFHSIKGGKQIFSYDRSQPTSAGRLNSFLDAVLAQAVKD